MSEQAADIRAALIAELNEGNAAAVIQTYQKGKVLDTLDANPKHRTALRTMVADTYPGTAEMMPETAVARAVAPALAQLQAERVEIAKERALESQRKATEAWHASLRKEGIRDADLPAVTKLAEDTANLDPQALALRWKAQNTPARSTAGYGRPLMPGAGDDAFFKGIQNDPDRWFDNRANVLWDLAAQGKDIDAHDWSKEVIA